jgi:TRAP transporter TAXI family solute receptor
MARSVRWLLVCVLAVACLLGTVGCRRGPDVAALERDLQSGLDATFGAGLFRIDDLRRMGSATYAEGIHVYYDAVIELERDYSLTSWKGLNLATLAFVVGATEAGISGFKPKGNAKGDRLKVQGRLSFARQEGVWKRVERTSAQPGSAGAPAQNLRGSGPDALLRRIREVVDRAPARAGETRDAIMIGELRRAVSRIDLRLAGEERRLTIGAGPAGGTYQAFGKALAAQAGRADMPAFSFESEGSLENAKLLADHLLEFALLQSDVAEVVHQGWSDEGIIADRDLRAVAALWPEAVHLVTLEGSGIRGVSDLAGRHVAIGQRGSGSRFNAVRIGLAAGIPIGGTTGIELIGLKQGIQALTDGRIDALFVTEATPSPALQSLASERDDVRFVSIEHDIVAALSKAHFAYYPRTVEAHTYPGQEQAFQTLGLACTLVTRRQVAADRVERLLGLLVDETDALSTSDFRAGFISPDTMRLGLALPLHEGAARFFAARAETAPGAAKE